jgi:SWI/SNF-related matrix-associated actin-dependent regulator 1 of chromatin subfamily A
LLDAKAWGPFFPFARRYCAAFRGPFGWDFSGASNLEELNDRLRSSGTMLRRRKADVLPQLPRVMRQVIPLEVDLSPILEMLTEDLGRLMGFDPDDPPFEIDPTKFPFELVAAIRHETGLVKTEAAIRFIEDQTAGSPEKIVVFAHHAEVLSRLHEALPGSVLVTGKSSGKARQKAVDAFQRDDGIKYFVASTQTMGVGVTLTASARVIFVEQDWTPAMLEQAESRLHRIGQADSVLSQYLVVHDSIDEKIMAAVHAKMLVINAAIEHVDKQPARHQMEEARQHQAIESGVTPSEIDR